jgi:ATP-dependent Clp protease ATP-binding subunit ClpA
MPNAINLDPALEARLKRMRLRPELPDPDTLTIKNVPANGRCFNKARTNVLIKRSSESMPCVVCVDEDLEYTGADPALVHAFAAAPSQQGWLVLTFGGSLHGDLNAALDYALGILCVDEGNAGASAAPPAPPRKLLAAWADNLTQAVLDGRSNPTLFRGEAIEQVAACTLGWQGRLPLILGEPGIGKTNLLHGVAALLAAREKEVLAVNMGSLLSCTLFESEREALLLSLLRETRESGAVLAMEQAEWAVVGVSRGLVLMREALDRGTRLIATSTPDHARRFAPHPLGARVETVTLTELCASDSPSIAAHHRVEIGAEVLAAAVESSLPMERLFPGKAVKLLDAAAARASLTGAASVTQLDVYLAASRMEEPEST